MVWNSSTISVTVRRRDSGSSACSPTSRPTRLTRVPPISAAMSSPIVPLAVLTTTMAPVLSHPDGSMVDRGWPTMERAAREPANLCTFVFLDADDEVDVDVEWTRENVDMLAEHWRRAEE